MQDGPVSVCAILASPPTTSGARTRGSLRVAAALLGHDEVEVTNLYAFPCPDVPSMSLLAQEEAGWLATRPQIEAAAQRSRHVIAAWGTQPLVGAARQRRREQLLWVEQALVRQGHPRVWAVGQARHPSRWPQYVSDRHARTSGGDPESRLRQVLQLQRLSEIVGAV